MTITVKPEVADGGEGQRFGLFGPMLTQLATIAATGVEKTPDRHVAQFVAAATTRDVPGMVVQGLNRTSSEGGATKGRVTVELPDIDASGVGLYRIHVHVRMTELPSGPGTGEAKRFRIDNEYLETVVGDTSRRFGCGGFFETLAPE